MAFQLYRPVFPKSFFNVSKQKRNMQQIVEVKSGQQRLICCVVKNTISQTDSQLVIYQPTIWNHDYIQALDDNLPINIKEKARELEKKVMSLIVDFENGSSNTMELLEQIDDIERLGLGYRFRNHIRRVLNIITYGNNVVFEEKEDSLHEASLRFRILRKHGCNVSQNFLKRFKDSHGTFIECLQTDVKGLLSLYEASHLAFMEESDLHDAKLFATEHLLKVKGKENDAQVLEHINQALEAPLYHRMRRLEARCYIDAYNKRQDANRLLLELATLDFNMTQAALRTELKQVSKWWKDIDLANKLGFVRDRLMECYIWTLGVVFEPQYHSCRVWLTKVALLINVFDDIYDVYGSPHELEIFTDVVKRWDIDRVEHMPTYLQLGFGALHNVVTEMGSNISIGQGEDITPILVKAWGELFETFLLEAKWTSEKHIPTLDVYLDNAWRSISGVVILTHGYFLINQEINKDVVESMEEYHDLMKWSSMVFRLYNDLAESSNDIESGEITINAISCYMHENDVCEEVAREYITTKLEEAWRKLIKVYVACNQELANPFIDMAINLAQISRCTYQYGDGIKAPGSRGKDLVLSLIIEPVTLKEKQQHNYLNV